jgi:BMFP domain-containing protein YqiC
MLMLSLRVNGNLLPGLSISRAIDFFSINQPHTAERGIDRPMSVRRVRAAAPWWCDGGGMVVAMNKTPFDDLSARINEALRNSPAQDIEKNLRELLAGWFDRMDLVMREDFEVQRRLLEQAQAKLAALEKRVSELEQTGKR